MSRRSSRREFPVAPILEALGAVNVPRVRGSGHRQMFCPFHDNTRTKAASVGEFSFNCFGCDEKGDAISLLRKWEDLSYADAVARAEALTGGTGGAVARGTRWKVGSLLAGTGD